MMVYRNRRLDNTHCLDNTVTKCYVVVWVNNDFLRRDDRIVEKEPSPEQEYQIVEKEPAPEQ